ncbi:MULTISPECIES: Uma2 family endonuclease [unclassified Streptomyces]|uniref:Uma2 family endonuclease n=1 Tax=unclassified Streptomyces TaxID=2593676 RepID=UPI0022B64028|nr:MULTISPECIES: Uma2 family endonuclease [unclassified Streptomyces]MCZ7414095.1 Uma2 family endonuclease [Streptomyces sp. WMMC897]MCZ7431090.1 Uma2 family endonuclease [Streptomyces sp. WMMC1477]
MLEQPHAPNDLGVDEYEELLRAAEELDTPDGFEAEVIGGRIVVSPWSRPYFMRALRFMRQRLEENAPTGYLADVAPFLFSFPGARRAYGPDLYVAEATAFDSDAGHMDGKSLCLVAEMTSPSTRSEDWHDKLAVYGRQVPVYLLLDMQAREASVFSRPSESGYRTRQTVPFGQTLHLPAPFDFDLDTSEFGPVD